MIKAWSVIKYLFNTNAKHRKGWKLKDVDISVNLAHIQEEVTELNENPDDIKELADIMGCCISYAIKKDWTLEQVEQEILNKLTKRYNLEAN